MDGDPPATERPTAGSPNLSADPPRRAVIEKGYRIRGRVQGVGFRWWTRSQALRLGLSGSVRNCADGSVEVHARGREESIATFRQRLAEGPPGARVESIEDLAASPRGDGFTILH